MNKEINSDPDLEIFYVDKSDWYVEDDGVQNWSSRLVSRDILWSQVLSKKVIKGDLNFSDFIFPVFIGNSFWPVNAPRVFTKRVKFENVIFYGSIDFKKVIFEKGALFKNCHMRWRVFFF